MTDFSDGGPKQQILLRIKMRGPQKTAEIASYLGVTGAGVRKHLMRLEGEGLLSREEIRGKVGRPYQVWHLTDLACREFPDRHRELTVRIMHAVQSTFGKEGLAKVFRTMLESDVAAAHAALPEATLETRVHALVEMRRDQGYMATLELDPVTGAHVIRENHCPVQAAAACQGELCENELDLFQRLLGEDVTIKREEHIQGGDRSCVYRIHGAPMNAMDV